MFDRARDCACLPSLHPVDLDQPLMQGTGHNVYAMCPEPDENLPFGFEWDQSYSFSAFQSPNPDDWSGSIPDQADTAASSHLDVPTPVRPILQRSKLGFLSQSEWREDGVYVKSPPEYISYKIEMKITLNNRARYTHTVQDIVLAPSAYWQSFLKPKLDLIVEQRYPRATLLDTNVKICINDRGEPNILKQDPTPNWAEIGAQFVAWGELFRAGKRLSLFVSFNYEEATSTNLASTDKRSKGSTTRRMLMERAVQLDAEGASGAHDPTWRSVYDRFRCPLDGCADHCFVTPEGHRHIPLTGHYMKELIKHVDNGGKLESHADVPPRIQKQLLAEEQQSKKRKARAVEDTSTDRRLPNIPLPTPSRAFFKLPGCAEEQLRQYVDWQIARHANPKHKAGFEAAYEVAMTQGMMLVQIGKEKDVAYFMDQKIIRGVAWEFTHEVYYWLDHVNGKL